ncbi:sugar-binding transcriptional regulator [Paenibacillus sp. 7124]|uniref:Sugar-binding transcriptional regulator n=1 Tax=Paenibacillus apii TaxID=1850370 RepID=A0A6M1PHK8_9BACL|nr:sugar-binding transcriptional regulator [Paenibacillus apii]NGM81795.1 sugar-binding transcriptional regulator [Paenibacillus apii]
MPDSNQERTRILVKASMMYYEEGLSQQEISERLSISRPQISRMLSAAKAEGIVRITIKNPFAEEQQYEHAITETFGIRNATVIQVPNTDPMLTQLHLGRAAAAMLESVLKDNDIIAIMAGRSVCAVGQELHFFPKKNMRFVPIIGGWGAEGAKWHANSNARVFGEVLKSKYFQLNAPAIVTSEQMRKMILAEEKICEVIQLARKATVAIVGIGQVSEEATIVKSGYFDVQSILRMKAMGAAANVCTSFINADGKILDCEEETRMVGLSLKELRDIPNVIAVAGGTDKTAAIEATLRGGWIDTLVTDMETAKCLLKLGKAKR